MADRHFALETLIGPSSEPFTIAEAKSHLRVDESADDTLIDTLITAARVRAENDLNRALITTTFELHLDAFPDNDSPGIVVPSAPLQSVASIKYTDTSGDVQTWDSSKYRVDSKSQPGRITPTFDESWPAAQCVTGAVVVRFVAGYGDQSTNVPRDILQAMLMLIGHWYENRESVVIGTITGSVPQAYDWLIAPHRVLEF